MVKKGFPLSLIKTKGQLYDINGIFMSTTKLGKAISHDTPTLQALVLKSGKTSFENAVNSFLIGLGTERGLLPSLEENTFEPNLVNSVLDLRNSGHHIECNH